MRLLLVTLLALASCTPPPEAPQPVADPVGYANPLMGTGGFAFFAANAFPGACVPHGLVKLGPDTRGAKYGDLRFIHYTGYWSGDDTAMGFSHLHLHGTGATDWGALIVQPVNSSDPAVLTRDGYQSKFSKKSEHLAPGSYEVTLAKWNVKAELTASLRAAHHRYTFADGDSPFVVLDLSRALATGKMQEQVVTVVDATTLRGSFRLLGGMSDGYGGNQVFFELRTNRAFQVAQQSTDGHVLELGFAAGGPVELLVGVSLVSAAGATANLEAELGGAFDFDAHKAAAQQAWRERLSRVTVYGGSEEDRATFYSAMRLAFLMPTVISDGDGQYVFGGRAGQVPAGEVMLSDFSLWDTYRTVHPLYALVEENIARDSVRSLARMSDAIGGLPRWPLATGETGTMVGAPADIVLADGVLRDVPGLSDESERLWQLASTQALATPAGSRAGMKRYAQQGWLPVEDNDRSVGVTVEYAHADFALAQWARRLGHDSEADQLIARARGWRSLFDASVGVLRPKNADGSWLAEPYKLENWDHYVEADALQTTFMPVWDAEGFEAMFGSREAAVDALAAYFDATPAENDAAMMNGTWELRWLERYHYWPSNETSLHDAYLFARLGRHDLTAKWVDWTRRTFFSATPEGVPGNDDGGTLVSWFVFAAMGLSPVPGTDQWIIGTPLFPKVELKHVGGTLTIEATGVSAEAIYVKRVTLDGKELSARELSHAQLMGAKKLVLEMSKTP
ncbi:MAG: GH92 family glycosyl hydrolase [Myxococcaceae bacterium]